ncbi:hypothetical protein GS429_04040 [Natronorubrum sp. JWXQ-INN-674]|uniref:Uncharacterized protein n=1 Tax=Natronorubrum halalkaliphilum TaxID=2691917 RepID=A0A6B0VJH8_9EURY|nr:hypothetical protein [Natronorubrum halalkaliphilum]MXV61245.1 hypothetical protein [Natronorubrum halalkaliphilum]
MGETKFTLIELHLDGDTQFGLGSIGSALPIGPSDDSEETPEHGTETDLDLETDDEAAAADEDGSGGKAIGAVIALVALVGIAVAAKKFRGDDEDELETEEQPDVIVN